MTRKVLEHILTNCTIFRDGINKNDACHNQEIQLSRDVLKGGWNIACFLSQYKNVDFRLPNPSVRLMDDVMWPRHKDKLWTTNEVMFVKSNRFPFIITS
jgi:hypothetical protein